MTLSPAIVGRVAAVLARGSEIQFEHSPRDLWLGIGRTLSSCLRFQRIERVTG
jgi:hypothetical protein